MERDLDFLKQLLLTATPSGYETVEGSFLIKSRMSEIKGLELVTQTALGTVAYKQGNGPKTILLSAHYDEIGFQVQYITDSGLLCISPLGGLDLKVLLGQTVEIYTKFGNVLTGIVGKKPIHVEDPSERNNLSLKTSDVLVDIGVKDKDSAKKLVSIGDYGVLKSDPILDFGDNRLVGRGLDDKIGVYILTQIAEIIERGNKDCLNDYTIIYAFFPQEETGLRGAYESREFNPDISIDIDTWTATDEGRGISKERFGDVSLGKGLVINHGADKNYSLNNDLLGMAENNFIPYQEICTRPGGTNTDVIQKMSGAITTHISIGIRNLHTPVETCDWSDVEGAIELLTKSIEGGIL